MYYINGVQEKDILKIKTIHWHLTKRWTQ